MASGERTISFYRVTRYKSPTANEAMRDAAWYEVLTALSGEPLESRTSNVGGRILIGEILFYDEQAHLKLLKGRDLQAWLGIYNNQDKSVEDLELTETSMLYETSIVSFLPYGNAFGIIQGSTSAPTASAVVEWLESLHVFGDKEHLVVEPVLSNEAREELRTASEATRIETTISTTRAQALEATGSRLSGVIRRVQEEFGPMKVTLILTASRGRGETEGRAMLREEADHLLTAAGDNQVSRAKARLIYFEGDDSRTRDLDFIKQRITAKRKIDSTGEDGKSIRNESAVRAIVEVAAEHETELRAAVGREASSED